MTVIVHKIFNGAILYDNTVISDVRDDLFVPDSWTEVNSIPKTIGGRGQVFFVGDSQGCEDADPEPPAVPGF